MNKTTTWIVVIILIVLVAWWGFTAMDKSKTATSEPIKIGAVYSLTGAASFWAESGKNAAELAVQEINASGGINGRPLEILYEDGQTDPSKTVSAFNKLVTIDGVDVLMGDMWAFLTNPMIPLADEHQKVLISATVMDASVEGSSPYFFTMGHSTGSIKGALQRFFDTHESVETIALICSNDPWGFAMTAAYEEVIEANGKQVIEKNCTTGFSPDYRTEAAKAKESGADAIFVNGIADRAVKVLKELGTEVPIVTDSNLIDGFENRESLSVGQLENVFVIDWHANDEFIQKYKTAYGRFPIVEAQNSYEVVRSIAKALENNSNDILQGLQQVKYEGVDGFVDFTTGDQIRPNQSQARLYKIIGSEQYQEI